jgi:MYXO-CTERM domain-containing protein
MKRISRLLMFAWLLAASLLAASAGATLPPAEYDQLRQSAAVILGGVVEHDFGGQARVRVEHVTRGQLTRGTVVTVMYPLDRGPQPPGAAVHYRRFAPGTRIMVWGQGLPAVYIVHGGIDVVSQPRPAPKRGGCAGCTVGSRRPGGGWWMAAAALLLLWRRRGHSRAVVSAG